jgi:hypothetical protein
MSSTRERVQLPPRPTNRQRASEAPLRQLLYSRKQASELLGGINVATIRQLEKAGRLKPIRPSGKKTGAVFFTAEELMAAVERMRASSDSAE